jgi:hypothetical protein
VNAPEAPEGRKDEGGRVEVAQPRGADAEGLGGERRAPGLASPSLRSNDPQVAIPGFRFGGHAEVTLLDRDGTFTVRRVSDQGFMKLYREMTAYFMSNILKRVLK